MLDEKSLKILRILQEKARMPNVEVARMVGMAPSAVLERIRKMERQGVIDGYEVRLNPEQFNRTLVAFIQVVVNELKATESIGDVLASISEVQEVHYVAGGDCYFVKVRVADTKELGRLIRDNIGVLHGVVSTKTATVLETVKETARIQIRS